MNERTPVCIGENLKTGGRREEDPNGANQPKRGIKNPMGVNHLFIYRYLAIRCGKSEDSGPEKDAKSRCSCKVAVLARKMIRYRTRCHDYQNDHTASSCETGGTW